MGEVTNKNVNGILFMTRHVLLTMLILLTALITVADCGAVQNLNIIYTGALNGELEPCGCTPKTDFGGLARLSGFLLGEGGEISSYVLIDAGNFTDSDTPQGRLKTEAMLHSFRVMKYDAVAVAHNESTFDNEYLRTTIDKYNVPAVSSLQPYDNSMRITRGTVTINVSTEPGRKEENMLNILLTGESVSDAAKFSGWDIVISSGGDILESPVQADGTIIAAGYPRGKQLGILKLILDERGRIKGFSHNWQDLGVDIPEDKHIRDILDDYDKKVAALLKESAKPPSGTTYLGIDKCVECHEIFVDSWGKTRHADAFSSLERSGKAADPECLVCHTVGFGEKGGFYSIETTPGLSNIQCEECHGIGLDHLEDFILPMRAVTESVCLKCHTAENSPDFDYTKYKEKIKHW
jgi:hypothetical protein